MFSKKDRGESGCPIMHYGCPRRLKRFGPGSDRLFDGSLQVARLDRFWNIERAELIALVPHAIAAGEDDDGNVLRFRVAPNRPSELKANQVRHIEIGDDRVEVLLKEQAQSG